MKLLILASDSRPHFTVTKEHMIQLQEVHSEVEIVLNKEDQIGEADIIAGFPNVLAEAFPKSKQVKWFHSFSAGVDQLLIPALVESDVLVSNSSGIHATPIAEHIIAFMLMHNKKFYSTFKDQQNKVWNRRDDLKEINGKTVFIVGLGRIGTEAARLAHSFGAHVVATNNETENKPDYVDKLYLPDKTDELLNQADFVVLCLPHTSQTHHYFDMAKFQAMKNSAVVINIGRGGVVYESDLVEALKQNIIGGACLDVTEEEPLPSTSPLWEMENVIITPHHSGVSEKYMDRAIDRLAMNLKEYIAGDPLSNLVDKQRGY
jgi:phosphoglycerate dehydrogenase-like enzyme